jgi:hypothetical protein
MSGASSGAPASGAVAAAPESILDDILTPMERSVKVYLTNTFSKDLIELLALIAVERPDDPHLWLGTRLLDRAAGGPYVIMKRDALERSSGRTLAKIEQQRK